AAPERPAAPAAAPTAAPEATEQAAPAPNANANGARAAEVHEALAAGERPGPASEAAPAAPQPTAPAAPAAPPVAPHLRAQQSVHALRFAETALQLRELVDVAASRGVAQARLQLHPAELGGIEVRLRVTAEGLTAAIAADRPEAVQALQQAGAELRRSLEQRGLTVLSVDVSLAGADGAFSQSGNQTHAGADRSADGRSSTDRTGGQEAAADAMEAEPTAPRGVPAGALVDVLA
ncbi:MAG TPA: flagellar hook-length control protein FliK, partial [Solirubrobacteraceae bacterium]|nr:flagellar hook-length control protein FliK [Solirubrobacteraceae bacterium]